MSFIKSSLEIIIYLPFANYSRGNKYSYTNRERKSHRFKVKSSLEKSKKNSVKKIPFRAKQKNYYR